MSKIAIRKATADDAAIIWGFIKKLAEHTSTGCEVVATIEDIQQNLFDPETTNRAIILCDGEKPIGFAVYFLNFSTWLGKNGLYLEDFYISPSYRGAGTGRAVLKHLANIAVNNGYGRFEWSVPDWGEPVLEFYESINARPLDEWIGYRLEGQSLIDFARK